MEPQDLKAPLFENRAEEPALKKQEVSRRTVMKLGALGLTASTLGLLGVETWIPGRIAYATPPALPNIQFDISNYIAPAETIDGTLFRFGPVYTLFLTAQLHRTPAHADQRTFAKREYYARRSSYRRAECSILLSLFPPHVGKPRSACCGRAARRRPGPLYDPGF